MSNRRNAIILVRGLPGAGKTTRAKQIAQQFKRQGLKPVLITTDDFFEDGAGNYNFDPNLLPQAHAQSIKRTAQALAAGKVPIVHNTFTQAWEAKPYREIAQEVGADVEVINVFDGGLSDVELEYRNTHDVPLHAIKRMRQRWDSKI